MSMMSEAPSSSPVSAALNLGDDEVKMRTTDANVY
jgi:hypothetical protein